MSARARWLAHNGFLGGALVAALALLIGFHSVVSDAVARAHMRHVGSAAQTVADPVAEQRMVLARRGE